MEVGSTAVSADVAVVGAGPAGSATAIACAQAGLRVVVCELRTFPRERVGETLHPGAEGPLARLGVLDQVLQAGFLRHAGIWVDAEQGARFEPYGADAGGPWRGFQAWRADLDAILLSRARVLGTRVLQPCRVLEPQLAGERVVGLRTTSGEIRADFVVDAAGPQQWLGRRLATSIDRRSPLLLARYGYVRGSCLARDEAPAFVSDETGWTWTARVRPGVYQWTRLNLTGTPPPAGYLPAELRGLERIGYPAGADVSWRALEDPAGPGYYAVGDAAAVLDPASSHGVLRALLSGLLAGGQIAGVVRGELPERIGARGYRAAIGASFEHDVAALGELYRGLPQPPRWLGHPGRTRLGEATGGRDDPSPEALRIGEVELPVALSED